jgi:hypothetical protein
MIRRAEMETNKQIRSSLDFNTRNANQILQTVNNFNMDANKIFQKILAAVENLSLNYLINKTPFSATISLKSSFVKHYSEDHSEPKIEIDPVNSEQSLKIIALENVVEQQKIAIEEKCMEEKIAKSSAESKAVEFKEEVLMLSSEKCKLEDKIKKNIRSRES